MKSPDLFRYLLRIARPASLIVIAAVTVFALFLIFDEPYRLKREQAERRKQQRLMEEKWLRENDWLKEHPASKDR